MARDRLRLRYVDWSHEVLKPGDEVIVAGHGRREVRRGIAGGRAPRWQLTFAAGRRPSRELIVAVPSTASFRGDVVGAFIGVFFVAISLTPFLLACWCLAAARWHSGFP
jgi:hypothetical protein